MTKIFTLAALGLMTAFAVRADVNITDHYTATCTELSEVDYTSDEWMGESGCVWIVRAKDEGKGPQFKPDKGGLAVKSVKSGVDYVDYVSVTWGDKSNEDIAIYGSDEPYTSAKDQATDCLIGTIPFVANTTQQLYVSNYGTWKYIWITATAENEKAAVVEAIDISWALTNDVSRYFDEGDEFSDVTFDMTGDYTTQDLTLDSGAEWIVTVKNEGDGIQFKPSKGGIATSKSAGYVKKVSVLWGSKSNESVAVYGSETAYTSAKTVSGTLLGTIDHSAGEVKSLDIDGSWPYILITATANLDKAAAVTALCVTWENDQTSIVTLDAKTAVTTTLYTLNGRIAPADFRGLVIETLGDGSVRKIIR